MKVVSIVSMKGGVGKTSIVAGLATALSKKAGVSSAVAIDLDPQNALQWHFGRASHDIPGLCTQAMQHQSLNSIAFKSDLGVTCVPYGCADEEGRLGFESLLGKQSDWLQTHMQSLALDEDSIVLIDTPPGPSPYLPQALTCAHLAIVILLPDAASFGTVPAMETYLDEMIPINPNLRSLYLLNQVEESNLLGRDMGRALALHLGERLIPVTVKADEALREALVMQQTVLAYDPHGQASHDLNALATWLLDSIHR
jgi:cellulose synthase operon protein YhjQ